MPDSVDNLTQLYKQITKCDLCAAELPLGPRPVLQLSPTARVLIAGQAPGIRVHKTGIPFDDPSGNRLREWMGIGKEDFYDATQVAIVPMGFCYPGSGSSGDFPPLKRCAETWRVPVLAGLTNLRLTLVIGQHAMRWHLASEFATLTDTVRAWRDFDKTILPLPHPSPRNNRWLKANPWFASDVLPELRCRVRNALDD